MLLICTALGGLSVLAAVYSARPSQAPRLLRGPSDALPTTIIPPDPALSVEIHYSPDEDLERIDVSLIDRAGATLDMAAYVLTDVPVIGALRRAAGRGVRVRVWREADEFTPAPPLAGALTALADKSGALVRFKPPGELMHLKGYCVDGGALRTGSANFSRSGETRQDNDLVILRGPGICAGFEAKFDQSWEQKVSADPLGAP